jgi:tellurite resistance protein TerC
MACATSTQWIGFHLLLAVLLALDLTFSGTRPGVRRALAWTAGWIAAALAFAVYIHQAFGHTAALEFLTGYSIEESLSLDNLFVFLLLFRSFGVAPAQQRRVLFWGVIGAILMRGAFIFGGIALLSRFHAIQYVFASILLAAALRLLTHKNTVAAPVWITALQQRFHPSTLVLALVAIEVTDVLFALDSVPAVLAVTHQPFIAYTSNLFAVLGLRALYFALAGMLYRFHHLHYGLALLLAFVATKMLIADWIVIPTTISLAIILSIVAATIAASLIWPKTESPA